ncbi:hypothetical protein RV01_GL001292 [Enterococcus dispar]|nr:hypothetical protein RV01_GL001292 [Enterococcus dispar]
MKRPIREPYVRCCERGENKLFYFPSTRLGKGRRFGVNLSTDAGLILVKDFMHSIGLSEMAARLLTFRDNRSYWIHDNLSLLEQLLFQLIVGYPADSAANSLKGDCFPRLTFPVLGTDHAVNHFPILKPKPKSSFGGQSRLERNTTELLIDLDSAYSDIVGNQEDTDYNARYETNGYHPLVAFDGLTGDLLKAELRSGNVYISNGGGSGALAGTLYPDASLHGHSGAWGQRVCDTGSVRCLRNLPKTLRDSP